MNPNLSRQLVSTIREQCRVCYTCVRECPAKAIRISNGQAEVIAERCIGCGNCVKVCSQNAKQVMSSRDQVRELLDSGESVAACLAPSFPAEFPGLDYRCLVGSLRSLGFHRVHEVGFGADLVAERYDRLMAGSNGHRYIGANCPAIVEFIARYHPDLVGHLAPIVSPMLALARALRRIHGIKLKIVFIGPCIAKKAEQDPAMVGDEVNAVLTFMELHELFEQAGLSVPGAEPSDFDPPHAGNGALFPIARGMLQAAGLEEDLREGQFVAADGRTGFAEAIKEFESLDLDARLLEVLCCNGCIMGPGMSSRLPLFSRRALVSRYVRSRSDRLDPRDWRQWMDRLCDLDLSRQYEPREQTLALPADRELNEILGRLGKHEVKDELNCGACGYDSCREHAIAIYRGLAESEMCLPHTIEQLKLTLAELARSHRELAAVQNALHQSEKLASMGQLAAAIAHEVNNPLGVVLMYAHLLLEKAGEDRALGEDLTIIAEQTDRCKKIVAGLLDFARENKVVRRKTDLGELVDKALRSLPPPDCVRVEILHENPESAVELDPDQMCQVLTNLISNAYEAMKEGGVLTIATAVQSGRLSLLVSDTGCGIGQEHLARVFEPFFTTKQLGKGTGLGLAVTYGIVKMHQGDIKVISNADPAAGPTGTTFTVTVPSFNFDGREPSSLEDLT